ncbi:MAG: class II aldolase and adducin N-terminal domain-containing protein [SAR324 cluster bacterium]|jgi:ribulose-5-phosphate 4-epimerase/fuculose-1-phosphate aldolase|nr:class II aldolase and adducin N-terminal domain-containing protein [SAR324 cluster bacterium]MEC8980171.1 class II aldolase and adducin N-terminal domain-containing protein [SAR324 cluster bacterium]MEC9012529.1 class II aldolase and adducin N-terminal domain-containing protein [SAR324 cluster bacterium]MEC9382854.1 class II aldolase and adducin N-terminal domain-containing protein [SAR324 cluster bacterium]MED5403931.1 class II aldolase and adducin N-terminal domain-containing protein [SAR3
MMSEQLSKESMAKLNYENERIDLACAFRWTVRMGMHEAIANHFSMAVNADGTRFLINPKKHFSRIKASDLLLLDSNDPPDFKDTYAPDMTAWGLHGSIHRNCPHARCLIHVHPTYSTVLASLADSNLQPIDQNTALFFQRYVIDEGYGGMAFEKEGERCATLLANPEKKVLIMGNHGVLIIGDNVADTFNRLYYFERAAETYIKALWTGKKLRVLSDEIAEKTAGQWDNYPEFSQRYFEELKAILDEEEPSYCL